MPTPRQRQRRRGHARQRNGQNRDRPEELARNERRRGEPLEHTVERGDRHEPAPRAVMSARIAQQAMSCSRMATQAPAISSGRRDWPG